jgi:5,10-methenyltetrahydrofolate synthetase
MTSAPTIARTPFDLSKAALRKTLLAARLGLGDEVRQRWDGAIGAGVVAWWRSQRAATLGVYWPLRGEPDLHAAYAELAALGVHLVLPVALEKDAPLRFASWQPGEPMAQDAMKVAVPAHLRFEPCPPALLVPCLGFNPERLRLGYGGGFYDRTLQTAPRPATLGVVYACMAAQFAGDAHDIALDAIVTERGLI